MATDEELFAALRNGKQAIQALIDVAIAKERATQEARTIIPNWIDYGYTWRQFYEEDLNKPGVVVEMAGEHGRFMLGDFAYYPESGPEDDPIFIGDEIVVRYAVVIDMEAVKQGRSG